MNIPPVREGPIPWRIFIYPGVIEWVMVTLIYNSRDLSTGRPILLDRAKGDCHGCLHHIIDYYARREIESTLGFCI